MTIGRRPAIKHGIRHVGNFTIYPDKLGVAIWHKARRALYERCRYQIAATEEFDAQMLRSGLIPVNERFSVPLSFQVYDVSPKVSRDAEEWEKLQALNELRGGSVSGPTFFQPWQPLVIYEAHRRGIVEALSSNIDCRNTCYVRSGLAIHVLDIEQDPDNDPFWWIHSWGLGDDQSYPMAQRIFLPL